MSPSQQLYLVDPLGLEILPLLHHHLVHLLHRPYPQTHHHVHRDYLQSFRLLKDC
jgi:hypothetical protein